jgi:two-component system alkaline phosphatase synthesis response regulator PhoP
MNTIASLPKIEKRVLVIEDDKNINRLIVYNLEKNGFRPESEFDGLKAVQKVTREIFDVVILDLMLPGVDGFRICKAIKDNKAAFNTFVVILSARIGSQDKLHAQLIGADRYLTKPFEVSYLMDTIKDLAGVRDAHFSVIKQAGALN